jgi:predicted  nucleic acid-binding Zn-ribbon protein
MINIPELDDFFINETRRSSMGTTVDPEDNFFLHVLSKIGDELSSIVVKMTGQSIRQNELRKSLKKETNADIRRKIEEELIVLRGDLDFLKSELKKEKAKLHNTQIVIDKIKDKDERAHLQSIFDLQQERIDVLENKILLKINKEND